MTVTSCRPATSRLLGAVALAGLSLASGAALAADPLPPVVALVVDLRHVLADSKAGQAIQGQMRSQLTSYQKGLTQTEQELAGGQQELQRLQSVLAQDALEAKRRELEQKFAEARKRYQDAQEDLQRSEAQALDQEKRVLQDILTELAKERGANIVIDKSVVLLLDTRLEVTEEAMRRLDAKLPSVTVNFSTGKQAPPAAAAPAAKPPPKKKS